MKPEEEVEVILWDWLKTKSKFVKEIYFNRKNILDAPVFTTQGINKKPDFLIKIDRGYGIEFVAVEIKDNSKSAQVHDASKILMYYENYRTGATEYFIDKVKIKLNHFVIATQSSPNGGLYKKEKEGLLIDNIKDTSDDSWRKSLSQCGNEPLFEWAGTSQFQRHLFSTFRQYRKEKILKEGTASLGILIAKIYSDGSTKKEPYLFIMNYNRHLIKPKWGCRYWEI